MIAITVQQPWADSIIRLGKNVENRTCFNLWSRVVGETIAIHAGGRWSDRGENSPTVRDAFERATGHPVHRASFVFGAVIGTVYVRAIHQPLTDCCQPWGEREYDEHGGRTRRDLVHLVLTDPRPVEPIECRGRLGPWTLPDDVAIELDGLEGAIA